MEALVEKEQLSCWQERDSILVEKASLGDQASFEALVQRYHSSLFAFVRKRVMSDGLAEDIMQSVWLQLYLFLPQIHQHFLMGHGSAPVRSWLFRVAINRCIDEKRRKQPLHFSEIRLRAFNAGEPQEELMLEEQFIDPASLPEEAIELQDRRYRLHAAIEALPEKLRTIVTLRYAEELTYKEIGNRLHMPENTAKTYFRRALPLLRTILAEYI